MALRKKEQNAVFEAVDAALAAANGRDEARKARVAMVSAFVGSASEVLKDGPPISGQAASNLCLTIEAMLQEPES